MTTLMENQTLPVNQHELIEWYHELGHTGFLLRFVEIYDRQPTDDELANVVAGFHRKYKEHMMARAARSVVRFMTP